MIFLVALLVALLQGFTVDGERRPNLLLKGAWASCPMSDRDDYTEIAFQHTERGRVIWELHMGPRDEFALFAGEPLEHIAHNDPRNQLTAYHYNDVETLKGGRNWSTLGMHFNVVRVPDASEDCYSFFVTVTADKPLRVARGPR